MDSRIGYEPAAHQKLVNSHFTAAASYWDEVYRRDRDVDSVIYQERLRRVLSLVDRLALPPGTPVLEIGCGAGYATVALARSGCVVDAIDAAGAMIAATRTHAARAGVGDRVRCGPGDIHALPFPDNAFGLALVIGVLPWIPSIEPPLRELCRALRPGGYAVVTLDNRWGLRQFVEPFTNPLLRPVKESMKRMLRPFRSGKVRSLTHRISIGAGDALLERAGLEKVDGTTLGFGPFTWFNHPLLPDRAGLAVHHALQGLADRHLPVMRSAGYQYIVLARKRPAP